MVSHTTPRRTTDSTPSHKFNSPNTVFYRDPPPKKKKKERKNTFTRDPPPKKKKRRVGFRRSSLHRVHRACTSTAISPQQARLPSCPVKPPRNLQTTSKDEKKKAALPELIRKTSAIKVGLGEVSGSQRRQQISQWELSKG